MRPHTWVELDLERLVANIRALREVLTPGTDILFVVKSGAYGHGLPFVIDAAWAAGVRRFAVAHLPEAVEIRNRLPAAEILLLGVLDPADVTEAAEIPISALVVSLDHARDLDLALRAHRRSLRVHVKVDTGMTRLGIPWETAPAEIVRLLECRHLQLEGLCSHFSTTGSDDRDFANEQARRFRQVVEACRAHALPSLCCHLANSGGILSDPSWDWDAVRPGILLYGYAPRIRARRSIRVRPCLSWRTRVVQVRRVVAGTAVSYDRTWVAARTTRLATLDVGYADGFFRALSNRGQVLLRGRRCPVVGRVTMNLTIVDVGLDESVREGDVATLLGEDGDEAIWADEMAVWAGTIPYEVLTSIRAEDRRVVASFP